VGTTYVQLIAALAAANMHGTYPCVPLAETLFCSIQTDLVCCKFAGCF
jgi:hypothetical protein